MSSSQLAEDRAYIERLDLAVERFKAALGTAGATLDRARQEVDREMLRCMLHAAAVRAEEAGRAGREGER